MDRGLRGLNTKSPESAASFGFIVLFPLAFVSNAMVPTLHMPGWMQAIADWNPVSAVTAGSQGPVGQPEPVGHHSGLADAASGGGFADLVGGDLGRRRPLAAHFFKQADDGVRTAQLIFSGAGSAPMRQVPSIGPL